MDVKITDHAAKRLRKRNGVKGKTQELEAEKAFNFDVKHSETKGSLNRYISHLFFNNRNANNIRIYNQKIYIFAGNTLITTFPLPRHFIKTYEKIKKEKINGDEDNGKNREASQTKYESSN